MIKYSARLFMNLVLIVFAAQALAGGGTAGMDIPYQKFVLKNGLTLIVHEDHKAPIAAVSLWYHVGSKNERPGKTGFAHLFEHLMFTGSEHCADFDRMMESVGSNETNGSTAEDRTNYIETVPTSGLETALWLESDRMGHLLGCVDQGRLDIQRGVVQNEKRQYENEPYAISDELIHKYCFPSGHPYSWTVIGEMADLSSATLADVHAWFKKFYGPSNTVLVIAGDVKPEAVRALVEKYFGEIPAGPPLARARAWIAKRTEPVRFTARDRVPQSRLYKVWNVPEYGTRDSVLLDLAAAVLSEGKNSRLYKRLVYDDQSATRVEAFNDTMEIAGLFQVIATAKPEIELSKVEAAVDEELARFLKDGPTGEELQRARAPMITSFVSQLEQVGGFSGKAEELAEGETYGGDPAFFKTYLKWLREATAAEVRDAARRWLADGAFNLEIHPFPEYETIKTNVDRTTAPAAGTPPEASFPALQRATLSNGLKVVLAERHAVPLVKLNLKVEAGDSADPPGEKGIADFAMALLNEGTATRTALQVSDELEKLGAGFWSSSALDDSSIQLSVLRENLDQALALYADLVLHPSYPAEELARRKKQRLASLRQTKASPSGLAWRLAAPLIYGQGHPYGALQTEAGIEKTTREELAAFHRTWVRPNRATLIVVGDTTLAEMTGKLEPLFKEWQPGETPRLNAGPATAAEKPVIYVVDKPGAEQSYVIAGQLAPPRDEATEIALDVMNEMLGGDFTSRINMNLRESKHWTYGAFSGIGGGRCQRRFVAAAAVQTDKTREAMSELRGEIAGIIESRPVTEEEFARRKETMTLRLPGQWETMDTIAGDIEEIIRYGLPDDTWQTYPGRLRALKRDDVEHIARAVLRPDGLTWIVVGDRAKIEPALRTMEEIGIKEVRFVDSDANIVK